jgi:hypothetical protein
MEQSEMQTTSDRFFEERERKAYLVPYLPVIPTSKSMQSVFLSLFILSPCLSRSKSLTLSALRHLVSCAAVEVKDGYSAVRRNRGCGFL